MCCVRGGILAAWTYNLLNISPEIDGCVDDFYKNVVGRYWPPERRMVENGYRDIVLPFEELGSPGFEMTKEWNLSELVGYLGTWSAVANYQKKRSSDPVEGIIGELSELWSDPKSTKCVIGPLTVRIWVK